MSNKNSNSIQEYFSEHITLPETCTKKNKYLISSTGALPLIISQISRFHNGSLLIISTDPEYTDKLEREINFFETELNFLPFPDWETLPYDSFSPHTHIISQRIETLYKLSNVNKSLTCISLNTALHKTCPTNFIKQYGFFIKLQDKLNLNTFRNQLITLGYNHVTEVTVHGEFTVKGSVLDIYPMGSNAPYRIDLFDDEVDSIRVFDPETQKSLSKISTINLLPAHEFCLSEEKIKLFRSNWRELAQGNPLQSKIYNDISEKVIPSGIEYYIPLFFHEMGTIFDYLAPDTLIIIINNSTKALEQNNDINHNDYINNKIQNFHQFVKKRYENLNIDSNCPLLPPEQLFLSSHDFFSKISKFKVLEIDINSTDANATNKSWHKSLNNLLPIQSNIVAIDNHLKDPLSKLKDFIKENKTSSILFCAESAGRKELMLDLFKKHDINNINTVDNWNDFLLTNNQLNISIAKLDNGFILDNLTQKIIVISESELYGQQVQQRRLRKSKSIQEANNLIRNLSDLKPDQYVVHETHGVGKYLGLETITINNITSEYLNLLYEDNTKLYVPVSALDKISRYSGLNQDNVKLNKLGNKSWSQAKQKALEKIKDTAAELLGIYAKRVHNTGFSFTIDKTDYSKFCAEFKFEETPDQALAITQVLNDMQQPVAMDRLISGDVGFGKTEVALRASFIAASNNKQVGVLVPTTLLAQQHYENFCDRFANFPIKIDLLSRFRSTKDLNNAIKNIESGKTDIIIGTHKLLQEQIKFKDLGLLIIDEEHRFGVSQKEKIKKFRSNIDILNLTATPIPRTLNLALSGIRDLSIITTPPQKRLAIKTFLCDKSPELIYEAISRELNRGGQVYYLHNNIKTITQTYDEISKLFPDAKIAVAHGQMRERELEKIMSNFYHRRYHILICTTIIETGIDIPSANTILMDRADKLGLAQIHQLRGRVGRSHHQAYAYLFKPKDAKISSDAQKRLQAITSLETLGAGFILASHDMEIRGTGNLLGDEQSGHIEAIGYNLYMELLNKAVQALKDGVILDLEQIEQEYCEVDLTSSALLTEDYIPDVNQRLVLYKRIASVKDHSQLMELKFELIDRFGKLPIATQNLFIATEIKIKATPLGIVKIDIGNHSGKIKFNKQPKVNHSAIINLIQKENKNYKLANNDILNFYFPMEDLEQKYHTIVNILEKIAI